MKICPECLERVDETLDFCPEDGTELREIHAREEDPLEGRVLDEKWVLESKIGGGGMGTVYRTHQISVDRTVAVKVLRSDLCEDDEHVERFFREANVASNINDPRCVTIYDFGQTADDHILYLAMEYLEGESLHERVQRQRLTVSETLEVGTQITRALETLHAEGVIHRDLKPENVFLVDEIGADVCVKLVDFGLAKVAQSEGTPVTETGQIYGTPEFMSPEQCMGSEIGPASDLYALGCLLYELVAGRTPFDSNSSVEVLLAHVNRPVPALDGRAAIPAAYTDLIMQLLEKNPDDRPGDVVEVRERLQSILATFDGGSRVRSEPASEYVEVESREELDSIESSPTLGAEEDVAPTPKVEVREGEPDEVDASDSDVRAARTQSAGRDGGSIPWLVGGALVVVVAAYFAGAFEPPSERESTGERTDGERLASASRAQSGGDRSPAAGGHVRPTRHDGGGEGERPGSAGSNESGRSNADAGTHEESTDRKVRGDDESGRGERDSTENTGGAPSPPPSTARREASSSGTGGERGADGLATGPPILTQATASRVFESKNREVRECFTERLGSDAGTSGALEFKVVIDASGTVERTAVTSSTVHSDDVEACVRKIVRELSFPPTASGSPARLKHRYAFEWSRLD